MRVSVTLAALSSVLPASGCDAITDELGDAGCACAAVKARTDTSFLSPVATLIAVGLLRRRRRR